MSEYKLIKAFLGLEVKTLPLARRYEAGGMTIEDFPFVLADDLEALLAKGVRVTGDDNDGLGWAFFHRDPKISHPRQINAGHTHTALLIGITPIEQDTAEGLLREYRDAMLHDDEERGLEYWAKLHERAKRLLAACAHRHTKMWEPHLAGARKCTDCEMVFNPNRTPNWQLERT